MKSMLSSLGKRLTYANVMATLGVFLALTSTAYAAVIITSKNIKDNTIQSRDVRDGTLAAKDIAAGAIATAEIKDGQVNRADMAIGARLPKTKVRSNTISLPAGTSETGTADCAAGEVAVGGGAEFVKLNNPAYYWQDGDGSIDMSYPADDGGQTTDGYPANGWSVAGTNDAGGVDMDMIVYVTCISA